MTASCVAITAASLASNASSQPKNVSGASATPSRDNRSYTTIFRTPYLRSVSMLRVDGSAAQAQPIFRAVRPQRFAPVAHLYREAGQRGPSRGGPRMAGIEVNRRTGTMRRAQIGAAAAVLLSLAVGGWTPAAASGPNIVEQWNKIAEDTVVGSGAFQIE